MRKIWIGRITAFTCMTILTIYAFAVMIPYKVRFSILMLGFILAELSYTAQIIKLHISLSQWAKQADDRAFANEIKSIRV